MARKVNLHDYREQRRQEAGVELDLGDGRIVWLDPPDLWPDEVAEMAQRGENISIAKALLGDDDYEAFIAAGGTAGLIAMLVADAQGVSLGESAASSS